MVKLGHPLEYLVSYYAEREYKKTAITNVETTREGAMPTCVSYARFADELLTERDSIYKRYPDLRNHTLDLLLFPNEDDLKKYPDIYLENISESEIDISYGFGPEQNLKPGEKIALSELTGLNIKNQRNEYMINLITTCIFKNTLMINMSKAKGHFHIQPNTQLANILMMTYVVVVHRLNDISPVTKKACDELIAIYSRVIPANEVFFILDKYMYPFNADFIDIHETSVYTSFMRQFETLNEVVSDLKTLKLDLSNKNTRLSRFVDIMIMYIEGYITLDKEEFLFHRESAINNLSFFLDHKKIIVAQKNSDEALLKITNTETNKKNRVAAMNSKIKEILDVIKSGNLVNRIQNITRGNDLRDIYDSFIKNKIEITEDEKNVIKLFYGNLDTNDLMDEFERVINKIANSYGGLKK